MNEIDKVWVELVMDEALIATFTVIEKQYCFEVLTKAFLSDTNIKAVAKYKNFSGIRIYDEKLLLYFDK